MTSSSGRVRRSRRWPGCPPSFAAIGEQAGSTRSRWRSTTGVERIEHVHHAGNSSGIVDGAALVAIGNEEAGDALGQADPAGRVVAAAVSGADPTIMLTGPAPAARKALAKAGLEAGDIDLFEMNEAFAAAVLRFMADLGVPHEKVNVNGGAIALGPPARRDRRDADRNPAGRTGAARAAGTDWPPCASAAGWASRRSSRGLCGMISWDLDEGIVTLTMDDPGASANTMNEAYLAAMGSVVERLRGREGLPARCRDHQCEVHLLRRRRPPDAVADPALAGR